jgi:hypothetical protein
MADSAGYRRLSKALSVASDAFYYDVFADWGKAAV